MPSGTNPRPLALILRQLWKEQEAAALRLIRMTGGAGLLAFDPNRWRTALIDRARPLLAGAFLLARDRTRRRIEGKRRKRSKSILRLPWAFDEAGDVGFDIHHPEAVEFINGNIYAFASSTNATTQGRLEAAYDQFRGAMTWGVEAGASLQKLTTEVMRIFRDPGRALTLATTELARAQGAGRLAAAKESGVCSGLRWVASSDACPLCRSLNGKEVKFGDPFAVAGGGPYAAIYHEPAHPHCSCVTAEVLADEWDPGG